MAGKLKRTLLEWWPYLARMLIICGLFAFAWLICFGLWFIDHLLPNNGWEFGYYGQFNRTKHAIEKMEGVEIVDYWQHRDLSLEDFGFDLSVNGGNLIQVAFLDNSPQKSLWRRRAIQEFVQSKIDQNTNNPN